MNDLTPEKQTMRWSILAALTLGCCPAALGADWRAVTTDLLAKEKTGYGGLSGVVVDRASGDVFIDLSDRGVFHSSDAGKTWERIAASPTKGRTETPGCFQLDPTGKSKRLLLPTVYGGPIAVGPASGGEWRTMDKQTGHVDWCAVDWTDPELGFVLALKHESGGQLLVSRDGGATVAEVGKGYGFGWAFDSRTAVVSLAKTKDRPKGGIARTTDAGKTFQEMQEFAPATLPKWHADTLYWLADGNLIRSADKGATWSKVGAIKDARYGPIFGKDGQVFVLTGAGVVESNDGGATWAAPIAVPKELKGISSLTWMDYDPVGEHLYVMKMGSELYRLSRGSGR